MPRKEKYLALHADPNHLFKDCFTVLYPKGLHEIWVGDGDLCGLRLRVKSTEGGMCLIVDNFDGSPPMEVHISEDSNQIRICQKKQQQRLESYEDDDRRTESPY